MELTEQTRRNIDIAKMMGGKPDIYLPFKYDFPYKLPDGTNWSYTDCLAYHTDAWLMPVVRWMRIKYDNSAFHIPQYDRTLNMPIYIPTEQLFIAVSDFAEWFNGQKQSNESK